MNPTYELWTKPAVGGRFTFSGVSGTLKECVAAIDEYPKCSHWFKRIDWITEAKPDGRTETSAERGGSYAGDLFAGLEA